jgi:hypothetical protein
LVVAMAFPAVVSWQVLTGSPGTLPAGHAVGMSSDRDFYGATQRGLQDEFGTRQLADLHQAAIVGETIDDDQRQFIESRDFFFLSTVDEHGWPTVSYKGGPVGVVRVEDERTIVFPGYDGNGMFLSAGNVESNPRIGLLFIDFERPDRLRLHASATVHLEDPAMEHFPGSQYLIRGTVENLFVNCARYVHPHTRVGASPYVPDADGTQPHPAWKRIDLIQPLLPASDDGRTEEAGGTITIEEYGERLAEGTS